MLNTVLNILLVILIIAAVILAILYFLGNKLQKRQLEQQQMLDAAAQTVSLLVIDKKKLKLTQAGLPKMVVDQTPKYMRWTKVPVVKAKTGIEDAPPVASFSFAYSDPCSVIVTAGKEGISIGPCWKMVMAQIKIHIRFTAGVCQGLFCLKNDLFLMRKKPGSQLFFSGMIRGIFTDIGKNLVPDF